MSVSIGIGLKTSDPELGKEIEAAAEIFGYRALFGFSNIECDVVKGVTNMASVRGWDALCLIKSPQDASGNDSFGIYQQILDLQFKRVSIDQMPFLGFVKEISRIARPRTNEIDIFFATEWLPEDRVFYIAGEYEDLASILSVHGCYPMYRMDSHKGFLQEFDDFPMIFGLSII